MGRPLEKARIQQAQIHSWFFPGTTQYDLMLGPSISIVIGYRTLLFCTTN